MSAGNLTYGGVPPVRTDLFTNQRRTVLQAMTSIVAQINRDNGWYEDECTVGDDIALLHSEVSEMLEAFRDTGLDDATGAADDYHPFDGERFDYGVFCRKCGNRESNIYHGLPKPEGFGSECADVLIRLLDTCSRRNVDLAGEFTRKCEFNRIREHRHGGKRL